MSILGKLRLGPNFFTAPNLLPIFLREERGLWSPPRSIDVHARLELKGTDWYARMRAASLAPLDSLPGVTVAKGSGIPWPQFMTELRDSKTCWSPFGYGELCWRDIEAFAAGSVLIKPDMSHLETAPDLYVANETYIPVRWNFGDLAERLTDLLHDEALRHKLAARPFVIIKDYIERAQFVDDMQFLLAS